MASGDDTSASDADSTAIPSSSVEELKQKLLDGGQVTWHLPSGETVVVEAEVHELFEGEPMAYQEDVHGIRSAMELPRIHVAYLSGDQGQSVGQVAIAASGLYGWLLTMVGGEAVFVELDVLPAEDGTLMQAATMQSSIGGCVPDGKGGETCYCVVDPRTMGCAEQFRDTCDNGDGIGYDGRSVIQFHAEDSYVQAESNWYDRMATAFLYRIQPMWEEICIDVVLNQPIMYTYNILGDNECETGYPGDNVVDEYQEFLSWGTPASRSGSWNGDSDTFVLWTGKNLRASSTAQPNAYCFGLGAFDTIHGSKWFDVAAVVEGTDFCCDAHDPDEVKKRSLVFVHEVAHLHGEENHPDDCRSVSDCNIMHRGFSSWVNEHWLTDRSKIEIQQRFFHEMEFAL